MRYESQTEAQPKPPWAKKRGGFEGSGVEGRAERSSRGPEGVGIVWREMFVGRGKV